MAYQSATTQSRIGSAGGAAALVALIGFMLVMDFHGVHTVKLPPSLQIVEILPDPPKPDPVPARKQAEKRKEGAASPPNLKSKATEIVAPPPPIVLGQPEPVVVAPIAGLGSDRSAGAAPIIGPGTGSGGQGNGLGSGDGGDGDGGGGGMRPILVKKIRYKNLPGALQDANVTGVVVMDLTVLPNGRATGCAVSRSSGNAALDAATCALVERDMRFKPALDRTGNKIADDIEFEQSWTAQRDYGDQQDGR